MRSKRTKGYIYLILSTAIYGLFGLFSRRIDVFGPFSQGAVRYGLLCATILMLLLFKGFTWRKIERKDIKWFLIWIVPASFQPILTYIAFTHLPIGITYFLLYSTMILGGIISGKLFFQEKFTINKTIAFILVIVGLVIIYKSDITLVRSVYVIAAFLTGLIIGFWNTLTKKVSGNYPELQLILLDGSSTFIVGLLGARAAREVLPVFSNTGAWLWIIAFALFGMLSSLLLIKGFKEVEAQVGSLILPTELIFASIFSYLFLGELLKFNVYVGGFMILLAALVSTLNLGFKKQTKSTALSD